MISFTGMKKVFIVAVVLILFCSSDVLRRLARAPRDPARTLGGLFSFPAQDAAAGILETAKQNSELTTDDLLLLKEGIQPRAFRRWDTTKFLHPCYRGGVRSKSKGFLFTKLPKSGGTTASSINLRIAMKLTKKRNRFTKEHLCMLV